MLIRVKIAAVVTFLSLCTASQVYADEKDGSGDSLWNPLVIAPLSAILIALGTAIGAAIQEYFKRRLVEGLFAPVTLPAEDRRNSIILLGIGRTGKTTLIRHLFENNRARPYERTTKYDLYSKKVSIDADSSHLWLYVSDYAGQNIGTLISAFLLQQKKAHSAMSYGHVNSLILMVDVFTKQDEDDTDPKPLRETDEERIQMHLEQWNDLALDAVFGLLTEDSLQYVCLFINKFDLMKNQDEKAAKKLVSQFDELVERLKEKAPELDVDIIVGSAAKGTGFPELRSSLEEHSVPGRR